jgi:membrane-associated protein
MLATSIGALAWVPTLVLTGYYAAGLIDGKPWLKAAALWLSITFFAVGTAYGIWRYRQEMHRPAEPVAVGSG